MDLSGEKIILLKKCNYCRKIASDSYLNNECKHRFCRVCAVDLL